MDWKPTTIPVAPYVLPDLAVPSLFNLAPRERIRITNKVPAQNPDDIPYFTARHSLLNVSAAIELGFSGLISINASADSTIILRDTMILLAVVDRAGEKVEDTIIEREYYGLSMRTAIAAWNMRVSANLSIEELVAQGTLNLAQSAMQYQCVGCGYALINQIAADLGTAGNSMNVASFQSIVLMEQSFWDYVVANYRRLIPVLLGVDLKAEFFNRINANEPSANYALFGIMKGRRCADVLKPNGKYYPKALDIDNQIVQSIYVSIVGPDLYKDPTAEDKKKAQKASFHFDDK